MPRHVSNPPNPWATQHVEWLEEPPRAKLEVFEEEAKSLLTKNDSPDVPFTWGANAYRGCQHGCSYCYARPGHQYLSFGAGTDFERKIVVKTNAAELFARELLRPAVRGQWIALSGVTDCYQPLEAHYGLTRRMLQIALQRHVPMGIITKGALVQRDADLLGRLARGPGAEVYVSVPFADADMARQVEPAASSPAKRFEAMAALHEAGVPVGLAIAPMIPGLNDDQLPEILERAYAAGARRAFMLPLRLPAEVAPVFEERLRQSFPDRADKVMRAVREMRGGQLNDPRFGARMDGSGVRYGATRRLFEISAKRLGFVEPPQGGSPRTLVEPRHGDQSAQGQFDW
ncbi:MAG: DNA repair photolyase [Planctomycetota bacterium]|jgi:DNA repair photolyase